MKGDVLMRPLIEILEDERTLDQRLESIYRYMLKTDDEDLLDILHARKEKTERDLDKTRNEMREYVVKLLEA